MRHLRLFQLRATIPVLRRTQHGRVAIVARPLESRLDKIAVLLLGARDDGNRDRLFIPHNKESRNPRKISTFSLNILAKLSSLQTSSKISLESLVFNTILVTD